MLSNGQIVAARDQARSSSLFATTVCVFVGLAAIACWWISAGVHKYRSRQKQQQCLILSSAQYNAVDFIAREYPESAAYWVRYIDPSGDSHENAVTIRNQRPLLPGQAVDCWVDERNATFISGEGPSANVFLLLGTITSGLCIASGYIAFVLWQRLIQTSSFLKKWDDFN